MNIYDFDDTIFDGDSSVCFFKYSLVHKPFITLWSILKGIKEGIKYLFKKSNVGFIKSELFSFVKHIKDMDYYMECFSEKYKTKIKPYYKNQQKDSDVIISASFYFIVKSLCDKLGIDNVIATNYDIKTGKIEGLNCKGKEKIRRFKTLYGDTHVVEAYSDSLSDIPMFEIAEVGYLVKGYELIKYESTK